MKFYAVSIFLMLLAGCGGSMTNNNTDQNEALNSNTDHMKLLPETADSADFEKADESLGANKHNCVCGGYQLTGCSKNKELNCVNKNNLIATQGWSAWCKPGYKLNYFVCVKK